MPYNKPETGKHALALHTRYIINGEKPKAGFPLTGYRNLTRDEMYEIAAAFRDAPRIGRIGTGRKRENELVAIPRGLLEYFCSEATFFSYIHDQWTQGKLNSDTSHEEEENS